MTKFLKTMLSLLLVISMLLGCGGICEARAEDLWDMAAPEDAANPDAEIKLLGGWWHILLLGVDSYTKGNNRGIGLLDAIYAHKSGRAPRTDGTLCRHVLEAALGICHSSESGETWRMKTTAERPAPLPLGYTEYPELAFAQN